MQKKTGDFSKNCSYLKLVMLLVLSAAVVLMFASFASADFQAGNNIVLQANYGYNFTTNTTSASLTGMDITYNGSAVPTGPPDNPGTNAFRVWLVYRTAAKIDGMGPNLNLDYTPNARDQSTMTSGSSRPSFPIYAVDDGLVIYTEKLTYAVFKVTVRNSTHMVFSYKFNNQSSNTTIGATATFGCGAQTTKTGCFNAGSCFWDDFGGFCKDNTQTGGGGSTGGGGFFATVMCSAFNVNIQECGRLNSSLCTNTSTLCNQASNFDSSRGLKCEDITVGSAFAKEGMCNNVPLMSTCCSWTGSLCVSNATKTSCKGSFNNQTAGAFKFCEDAGNSSTQCANLKTTNYMPCKFDNSSTPERISNPRCVFDSGSVFGDHGPTPNGGGFGSGGFFDISTQAACQASGGQWKTFTYEKIDPLYGTKSTVTESHCEQSFGNFGGSGALSCDSMCPACESGVNAPGKGPFSNTSTQAKFQCENSSLGICKWINNTKSANGLGFCNFDKSITDFGGGGNCQNDCFACNSNAPCTNSKGNCTWTTDQFNQDFNGDGTVDGWCDPKAYQSFNSCATNCNACFKEFDCNTSAMNTGMVNCTWIDSSAPKTTYILYNVSNAGINPNYGYLGCIKVSRTGMGANRSGELCSYPGDEDGDGQEDCKDFDCSMDPACGFGLGGGFKPTVGGTGGGSGSPSNSSQLGFESNCFNADDTNQTYCTSLSGCTWKQIGPVGLCDPAFQQQMGGGMQMDAPPTILGTDAINDAGGQDWLDIAGIGYHDGPQNMDLGLGLKNITHFVGCKTFHAAKSLNRTGKYYRFIDVDANASTGCNASSVGGLSDVSGYEYKVVYENNGTTEVKLLFKCGLNANQFLNNRSKWVLVTKAQVASMEFGCYIDDFMVSQGFAGVHIQLINKVDISNPKQNIKIYAVTANATTNDTWPVDAAGPFFYTPGSVDFKMEDCGTPGVDIDGDGYTSDQDPDCAKFTQYGFVPTENGPKCKDGSDNDGNELTDCADPGCKYDGFQCGGGTGFGYKKDDNDKTAPKVSMQQVNVFPDGAMIKVITNEPANTSVDFFGNNSACTTVNETVLDSALTTSSIFDDYKMAGDVHLDSFGSDNRSKLDYALSANKTYFFKTKICDLSGNCAKSACQNFTTKASSSSTDCSTCSFVVSFDSYTPPASFTGTHPLANLTFKLDFGGDGSFEFNNTGGGSGQKANYTATLNTTIVFTNPQSSEPWEITLKGLDITSSLSSVISNLSTAFLYNTSSGNTFMGMDGDKFEAFTQTYGVDTVQIKLPVVGDSLKHCDETNLSNCADVTGNATKVAQDSASSTWNFPVTSSLKFSMYQVEGNVAFRSDKSSYHCTTSGDCLIYVNVTNDNTTLKNLLYNLTVAVAETDNTLLYATFGLSTYNGSSYNFNGSVNPELPLNLTQVNLSDSALQFRINMTLFNFSKASRFTFRFNATQSSLPNITDIKPNISTSVLQPYIDVINLTSPANSATVTTETTTFTYKLFSEFNTIATYNQTCYLRLNGTIVNSSLSANGTAVTLSNNVTIKDGTNAWNVSCQNNETSTDLPGFSATRTFTSGTPPTISVTSPGATTMTNDNTTTITFTLNDTGGVSNLSTTVYFNSSLTNSTYNASVQGTCSGSSTSLSCSLTINNTNPLPAGTWALNVTAKDNSANTAFAVVDGWIVDLFAPVLTNVTISDNYVTNSTVVAVSINVTDNQTTGLNVTAEFSTSSRASLTKITHPFWNGSVTLVGAEGINTLTIRVFDNATNVQTTTASYWIDTTSPTINITNPSSNGTTVSAATSIELNWTVTDVNATSTNVSVYDLLGNLVTSSTVNNQNGSVGAMLALQPGTYTASIGASDGAGNGIKLPSTAVRFTVNTQQNTTDLETKINTSFGAGSGVIILNSTGQAISGNAYFNQTLIKKVVVNATRAGVNVTVNITALGLYFNENKTNVIALEVLPTSADGIATAKSGGLTGIDTIVLYKNMSQYISDTNYTDASGNVQWVVLSISKPLAKLKALFINDDVGKDLVVLSQCASNTVPTTTPNKTNSCYTNGTAFVNIYVPHLSGAGLADPQNGLPTINYTTPAEGVLPDLNNSNLVLSVLVQSVDLNTSSCKYNMTNAAGTALVSTTSVTPTQVESGSANYTITVDTDTNLANASINNLTVQCASNQNNISTKTQPFKVNDVNRPIVKTLTSSATTGATVTLTWTLTTNENATCRYTTSSTANNFANMTTFTTTGAKTHTSGISYTSDTSGTYYFACNDTVGNGNNLNYTNSSTFSVDVTEATTAAAASSGGGGSTSISATTAEGASATKKWITALNPGATATMNILDAKIPVTSLSLEVANRVEKVEIKVTKLDKAPAAAVPEGTGKVHSYLKVDTQNLKAEDVKSAKFKFKLEKTWLTQNNYKTDEVLLVRFDGVKWADLPTKSLGATDGVETFEAVSPGFSTFAIVGRTKVEAVKAVEEAKKAEEAAKQPEVKEEPKVEEKKAEKKAEAPVIPTQPKKPYTGWIVVLVIVAVAVAAYFVWKKKQG